MMSSSSRGYLVCPAEGQGPSIPSNSLSHALMASTTINRFSQLLVEVSAKWFYAIYICLPLVSLVLSSTSNLAFVIKCPSCSMTQYRALLPGNVEVLIVLANYGSGQCSYCPYLCSYCTCPPFIRAEDSEARQRRQR